jgi:hypothetical protein
MAVQWGEELAKIIHAHSSEFHWINMTYQEHSGYTHNPGDWQFTVMRYTKEVYVQAICLEMKIRKQGIGRMSEVPGLSRLMIKTELLSR